MKNLFVRIFLTFLGAAAGLSLLNLAALVFPLAPLSMEERLRILNDQQLSYSGIESSCSWNQGTSPAENRIAVFGGSSAQGAFATPRADFASVLGRNLAQKNPRKWEVQNFAMSAKNSYWVKECVRRVGGNAGVWIIYEGHNDFANLYNSGVSRTRFLYEHPLVTKAFVTFLQWPAAAYFRFLRKPFMPNPSFQEHEQHIQEIVAISERNYREIVAEAQAAHVQLVLATVISSLDWDTKLDLVGAPDGKGSSTLGKEGNAALAAGNAEEALKLFRLARDRDIIPSRAPSSFNAMIRRLANEYKEQVTLVDLEESFERRFKSEKIGCRFFGQGNYCDQLHPNDFTHAWIAEQLQNTITLKHH